MIDKIISIVQKLVIIIFCVVSFFFFTSLMLIVYGNILGINFIHEIISIGYIIALSGSVAALGGIILIVTSIKEIWNSTK